MWLGTPLNDILSSRAKVAALRVVCASPVPLSGREIARRAGISSGSASKVLGELAASGVMVSRDQGRAKTYELGNQDVPLVEQLRNLFALESRRQHQAIDDLVQGVPGVLSVILFGSEARGEAQSGSDADLLIVLEAKSARCEDLLQENALRVAHKHLLPLSWHLADLSDLRDWETTNHPLWRNILAEGVCLRGTPPERLKRRWQRGKTA